MNRTPIEGTLGAALVRIMDRVGIERVANNLGFASPSMIYKWASEDTPNEPNWSQIAAMDEMYSLATGEVGPLQYALHETNRETLDDMPPVPLMPLDERCARIHIESAEAHVAMIDLFKSGKASPEELARCVKEITEARDELVSAIREVKARNTTHLSEVE